MRSRRASGRSRWPSRCRDCGTPRPDPQRYRRAVRMLDASARYRWHARSRFSSANNHLVGELAGLATVHLLFPELASAAEFFDQRSTRWPPKRTGRSWRTGAGAEQSVSVPVLHRGAARDRRAQGGSPRRRGAAWIDAALDRSARYLCTVVGSDDPTARYGDDDDGFCAAARHRTERTVREHLAILAAVTGDAAAAGHGSPTLMAAWLRGARAPTRPRRTPVPPGPRRHRAGTPRSAGWWCCAPEPRRLTMDVGPPGYLSIAAHRAR